MLKPRITSENPHNASAQDGPSEAEHGHLFAYLKQLLENLDGVQQALRYHPEGDTLYHSLQVFQCALDATQDPVLLAAALFHDVGKAIDSPTHHILGAEALSGILDPHIVWLVEHHLDLLRHPERTRAQLKGSQKLADLESLRIWDLQGRDPNAETMSVDEALAYLTPHAAKILLPQ